MSVSSFLEKIAASIVEDDSSSNNIGVTGKAGEAVFLYHYGEVCKNLNFRVHSKKMVEKIADTIDEDTSVSFFKGLAGFGCVTLYLTQQGFLNIDIETYFEDLDRYLYERIHQNNLPLLNSEEGITGIANYFIFRLKYLPHNSPQREINLNGLSEIIDALKCIYNSYYQIMSAVDVLLDSYHLIPGRKCLDFLNYAFDKFETMTWEDRYFLPSQEVPYLEMAFKIFEASHVLKDLTLKKKGIEVFKHYSNRRDLTNCKNLDELLLLQRLNAFLKTLKHEDNSRYLIDTLLSKKEFISDQLQKVNVFRAMGLLCCIKKLDEDCLQLFKPTFFHEQ